jgi:hypothetical protein
MSDDTGQNCQPILGSNLVWITTKSWASADADGKTVDT